MIVVAGVVSAGNTATISLNNQFEDLPSWVLSKIYPLGASDNVCYSKIDCVIGFGLADSINAVLTKQSNTEIQIYHQGTIGNADSDVTFRVTFDLLIDNEQSE